MDLYRSLGQGIVSWALWMATVAPPYIVLAVLAGVNPWLAMGVIAFTMYAARYYWQLNDRI